MIGYRVINVGEGRTALVYKNGRFSRAVGPGRLVLWRSPFVRREAVLFDVRRQAVTISGQELLTKDRVPVRVTLAADYRIVDPAAANHAVSAWGQQLYLDLQLALRERVDALSFDELLDRKTALGEEVRAAVAPQAAGYGIALERAAVKDVSMPAAIREMMLQTVAAEKAAAAGLVRAREEVAAARARANAARLMAENPAVLRLKELETLAEIAKNPSNTIVFGGGFDPMALTKAGIGRA